MDTSIVAPRAIWGDIQKFFISSNLCQDGSSRLFLFHIMIIAKFLTQMHAYLLSIINLYIIIDNLSKMLTHKNVTTTQIYADLVNSKKRETANKISLKYGKNSIITICIIQRWVVQILF